MNGYAASLVRRLLAVLLLLAPAAALADTRVALVIGQSAYRNVPRLPNPVRDAQAVAAGLRRVGFSDVRVVSDLDKAGVEAALQTFATAARTADVALVYYAGHGVEIGGTNYLVPVNARLAADSDVQFEAVSLDLVLSAVRGARQLKLVVLDACRDNPFLTTMQRAGGGSRSVSRGLARVEPDAGTLVAYAAREGSVAADGDLANSPFTTAFLRNLETPGLEVRLLFGKIHDDVLDLTRNRQEPATYASLGGTPFYFVSPGASAAAPTPVAQSGLNGTWTGFYRYDTPGQRPVQFGMLLATSGGRVSGSVSEPNTFGDTSAPFLRATIDGTLRGDRIAFVKTYDGTGGQSHSIQYTGTLDAVSKTIRGRWGVPGATGTFELKLSE